jgi:hypothetical protein
VRPERIAGLDQPLAAAARQPVGREQVLGHVGVEAGAEDPEPALDDERKRGRKDRHERNRARAKQPARQVVDPTDEERGRRRADDPEGDHGRGPLARQPHRRPADRDQSGEANRRRELGPGAPPAHRQDRLSHHRRGAQHEQEGRVGAGHPAASIDAGISLAAQAIGGSKDA